ncbi:MAG: hypothetical protein E7581_05260 [Ruminococcaceae bacterium]|nr:hypothetical protein [Oscillospiraceae bacterium]
MFKKCLKYDMRALGKIWLIASAVMLLLAVICALGVSCLPWTFTIMEQESSNESPFLLFLGIALMLVGMLSYIAIIYSIAIFMGGTNILLYVRYYLHFFTDQGYLTFTLPVKRSTLFWSKAVSGMIYMLGSAVVSVVSALIVVVGFLLPSIISPQVAGAMGMDFSSLFAHATLGDILCGIVTVILFVVLMIAIEFASLMMQYLIITLAATMFRNLKFLSVIIAYVIVGAVFGIGYFATYFIWIIYLALTVSFLGMGLMSLFTLPVLGWLGIWMLMLIGVVAALTAGVIFANFTMQRLERKLNLA